MSDCTIKPKLKPCPFCGGKAKLVKQLEGRYALARYSVSCNGCGLVAFYEATEAEAVEAWNTRAERTCRNKQKDVGMFECSECGISGITIKSWGLASVEPARCPNCGAKVVSE